MREYLSGVIQSELGDLRQHSIVPYQVNAMVQQKPFDCGDRSSKTDSNLTQFEVLKVSDLPRFEKLYFCRKVQSFRENWAKRDDSGLADRRRSAEL